MTVAMISGCGSCAGGSRVMSRAVLEMVFGIAASTEVITGEQHPPASMNERHQFGLSGVEFVVCAPRRCVRAAGQDRKLSGLQGAQRAQVFHQLADRRHPCDAVREPMGEIPASISGAAVTGPTVATTTRSAKERSKAGKRSRALAAANSACTLGALVNVTASKCAAHRPSTSAEIPLSLLVPASGTARPSVPG